MQLALMNSRVLVRVQKLNRFFNGDNVVVLRLVNEIDDGRQCRAFSGSGKRSTLAAVIDLINEAKYYHIVTIEDPIEFLHTHKNSTIHQRELHSDTPNFALALLAALRQAPKVILVGEMRDRETIEVALEAAETGHLVLSTLHTIDASKTVDRIIGVFPKNEE